MTKPIEHIEVPLRSVYAAALLACHAGNEDGCIQLKKAAAHFKPVSKAAADWVKFLATNNIGSMIPFECSPLDIHVAASLFPVDKRSYLRLYSDLAIGELGFFALTKEGFTYVDRYPMALPDRSCSGTILDKTQVTALLNTLLDMDREPVEVDIPDECSALMVLHAPWLGELGLPLAGLLVAAQLVASSESDPTASFQPGSQARRSGRRTNLGTFTLKRRSDSVWHLEAPTERVMEVHAASATGQRLYLESTALRIMIPLPDFLGDGNCVRAALDPIGLFSMRLGGDSTAICRMPLDEARRLVGRHRWFCPADSSQWTATEVMPTDSNNRAMSS